jgi:2-keto-3-deoxygluconate permease
MKIKQAIERFPGGMMMVPMACGAVVATFAPRTGIFFGSFTDALFTGALPILAVFYVCMGATISVRSLPGIARRGGVLMATKIALGVTAGAIFGYLLGRGPIPAGRFAGISTLAIVASMNDTNGGLYMALMRKYGSAEEAASYSVMALESGPFLTMVTLGVAGLTSFPWQTMLGAILPLCIGMVLGNLDPEMSVFLGDGAPVMIPFFAFALGSTLNLYQVWTAGLRGLLMGIAILLVSAIVLIPMDRLIGGDGTAGIAASTTAGNAAAVPMLIAAANSSYAAAAAPATVLVASCVVITSFAAPPLTAWWHRHAVRSRSKQVGG